jgi:hypothetical protein
MAMDAENTAKRMKLIAEADDPDVRVVDLPTQKDWFGAPVRRALHIRWRHT